MDRRDFGFFTTKPNVVARVHEKAMPVILRSDEERDVPLRPRGPRQNHCSGRCLTVWSGALRRAMAMMARHRLAWLKSDPRASKAFDGIEDGRATLQQTGKCLSYTVCKARLE